jgi:anti-sigma-K factor RskA
MPMTNEHLPEAGLKARNYELAQRFVDQELTPGERESFADRIGRDGALRRRVIALQHVAEAGQRMARPAASAAFVAGVLERTSAVAAPPTRGSRLAWLWTPHTMQWNLAQAAAVVVLAVAAGFGVARAIDSRQAATSATATGATPVMVRLVVLQPDARSVHAVGDFNGWDSTRTSLQQVSTGVWSVTLPLTPGRYEYMFVVDGQRWVGDPAAVEQADDGFGARNAVLEVLPPGAPL